MGNTKSHNNKTNNFDVFNVPQLMTTTQFHDYVIKNNLDKLPSLTLNLDKNILIEGSDLALLTNITKLNCGLNQNITDHFIMANSETLHTLHCGTNNYISDNSIKLLRNLRCLYCDGNNTITNDGIKDLVALEFLDIGRNPNLSDDGILNLVNLRSLNCSNMRINENKNVYRFTDNGLRGKHLSYLECCDPTQFSSKLLLDVKPMILLFGSRYFYECHCISIELSYDGHISGSYITPAVHNENKIISERGWNFETNHYLQKLILGGTRIGRKPYYFDQDIIYAPIPQNV